MSHIQYVFHYITKRYNSGVNIRFLLNCDLTLSLSVSKVIFSYASIRFPIIIEMHEPFFISHYITTSFNIGFPE